jgi:hypothetical protein
MPQIGERIFVLGGNKKYCALTNEEIVRYIGTDWTSIRIGLLAAINTDGTNNITGRLAVGVCSGSTNPVMAATTTLFCGMRNLSSAGAYVYNANAGFPYFSNGITYGLRRVGNTDTTAGVGNTNMFVTTNTGSLQRRSLIYVDLNKIGANSEQTWTNNTTQFGIDFNYSHFLEGLEYPGNPVVQNTSLFGNTIQTLSSFSEAPGPLDHVDIAWSGLSQAFEIYAFGVWRKA